MCPAIGWTGLVFPASRGSLANSSEGHEQLIAAIREMLGSVKVGFEAKAVMNGCSGHACRGRHRRDATSPGTDQAFALSRGTRAKTDRSDAELIARFMLFRPDAGRRLPSENLRVLRALTTRWAQIVDVPKRLAAQITARKKQSVPADVESMDEDLKAMLEIQIGNL